MRQLIEKSWEHKSNAFFTFTNLKKVYNSVPRQALLRKLGVPESSVQLIRSFHSVKIRLNGEALDTTDVHIKGAVWLQCYSIFKLALWLRDG